MLLDWTTYRYEPRPRTDEALVARIREIAMTRVRYGFWRIYALLRREIISGFTASTSSKGSICAIERVPIDSNGSTRSVRTSAGAWIS